jgi:hypothetical protein
MNTIMFDHIDEELRQKRIAAWRQRHGPRVGDYVEMADGTLRRLTHDWGTDIQTTSASFPGNASFYFTHSGHCSFSGSLDSAIPKSMLEDTGREEPGSVWFFHHDQSGASRGVQCTIPCRVYRQVIAKRGEAA